MWRIESHYPLRDIIILFYFIPLYTILFYFISSNILLNLFQSSNILFISRNFDLIFRYNFSFLFTRLIFFLEMIWNNFGILRSGTYKKKGRWSLIRSPEESSRIVLGSGQIICSKNLAEKLVNVPWPDSLLHRPNFLNFSHLVFHKGKHRKRKKW